MNKQNWKFSSASSSNSTSETRWLFTQKYFRCTTSSSVSNYLYNSSVESINSSINSSVESSNTFNTTIIQII